MPMNAQEIESSIEMSRREYDLVAVQMKLLDICQQLNARISELESRLEAIQSGLNRTADIASCLANGIKPD